MMDERGDIFLIRSVKKNRTQTLNEISIDYNNHAHQKVSTRTIQRRLHFYGFKRHKVRMTLTVSESNRKRRLQWCKSLKCHTIANY
jgi:transcriptional regulator with AAA-type ATPase domain